MGTAEYPRIVLRRKASLSTPTLDSPLSSSCSPTEVSVSRPSDALALGNIAGAIGTVSGRASLFVRLRGSAPFTARLAEWAAQRYDLRSAG